MIFQVPFPTNSKLSLCWAGDGARKAVDTIHPECSPSPSSNVYSWCWTIYGLNTFVVPRALVSRLVLHCPKPGTISTIEVSGSHAMLMHRHNSTTHCIILSDSLVQGVVVYTCSQGACQTRLVCFPLLRFHFVDILFTSCVSPIIFASLFVVTVSKIPHFNN